jgi:hypothetical protein
MFRPRENSNQTKLQFAASVERIFNDTVEENIVRTKAIR